jgi:hypothetical protein
MLLYGFPRNTEVIEKPVNYESAMARVQEPVEEVTVTLEVYGAYALPEVWKSKIVSYEISNPNNTFKFIGGR